MVTVSLHKCPRCGKEIGTNNTVTSSFQLPPTLLCVHGEEAVEMELIDEGDIREEAIVDA